MTGSITDYACRPQPLVADEKVPTNGRRVRSRFRQQHDPRAFEIYASKARGLSRDAPRSLDPHGSGAKSACFSSRRPDRSAKQSSTSTNSGTPAASTLSAAQSTAVRSHAMGIRAVADLANATRVEVTLTNEHLPASAESVGDDLPAYHRSWRDQFSSGC
jgi:hypothetical protein